MPRHCDEDSGRSSCSAGSFKVSPILKNTEDGTETVKLRKEASTNTDLKVSIRPRSCVGILKSPGERDPFPSCRLNGNAVLNNIVDTPRKGGLTNAKSTLDIASSTRIEQEIVNNAISMSALHTAEGFKRTNFRRGKPVQRAASRLYRADVVRGERKGCVGPEFIVRTSQEPKFIDLTLPTTHDKRIINVVLLNGQNVRILCDPNTVTAGQLFEALIKCEKYEHNFMLGIAVLISGDFIFLPDEYKVKKVAPESWVIKTRKVVVEDINFTIFLRIKFFLPTNIARNIQGGDWRNRVYLQLRRSTIEGQLTSTIQNLIMLSGYALHIEFGEFTFREHGSGDYFLLEHYLPESLITNDMTDIKLKMKRAHETRRGLDKSRAIINYITLAQTFRDYGGHFYSAVWATRDGFCRDVWLSIGPRGVTLYSRNNISALPKDCENTPNRIVLQSLPWHHIHTFYYSKKNLYIIPNNHSGLSKMGVKYKLRMTDNKSYFSFWLASFHHRLYLKLYAKEDFINFLSDELSCPLENTPVNNVSNYQDSYNIAVRNQNRKPLKRRFKVDLFERKANKENRPSTEDMLRQILSPPPEEDLNKSPISNSKGNSSNDGLSSSESCSLPRRHGVKMGTRVFNGIKTKLPNRYPQSPPYSGANSLTRSDGDLTTTQSDSDDLGSSSGKTLQNCKVDSMKLLPERQYNQNTSQSPTAYVLESPKVYKDAFSYNLNNTESCINASLYERLDTMGCVQGERIFVTATLKRDDMNTLGLQVAEGSDGNVYIKSITSGGPADLCTKLLAGDQIISVNGQTLLNVKYEKALTMLQSAPRTVELIVLQNSNQKCSNVTDDANGVSIREKCSKLIRGCSADDVEITDDELLNEEALKTIYALIKLTKDKVINRMKEKGSLNTPNRKYLEKCLSDNKVYDESDYSIYSSQENSPQKYDKHKFNTWRGQVNYRPKRRPLSLSFPADVNVPDDYFKEEMVLKKSSLKDIKSSLNNLDENGQIVRNIALPRNYGLSRKWIGPVRYPVTPCKNDMEPAGKSSDIVVRRHFIYGAGDSDEDQIFL